MTYFRNTSEGGIEGAHVTESNSAGLSGDPYDQVTEEGLTTCTFTSAAAMHGSKGIRFTPDGINRSYVWRTFVGLKLKTSVRFYFRVVQAAPPGGTIVFAFWANTANTGQRLAIRLTSAGIVGITNAGVQVVWQSSAPLAVGTIYRVEVGVDIGAGTISYRTYLGENVVPIPDLSVELTNQSIGTTSGAGNLLLGMRQVVNGAGTYDLDEVAIDDTNTDPLGPAGLYEIPLTAQFLGSGVVRLSWLHPGDAPAGVTIARAPGLVSTDGNGRPVFHPQYNPMTIPGAAMIATNVTASPYIDNGVPLGSWTYWVARTL